MIKSRVNTALIRRINTIRVLHCLRENPGISQNRLGILAQLDKATISTIINHLIADGLVDRQASRVPNRVGRPEAALFIPRSAGLLVGVRMEPEHILLVLSTLAGDVLGSLYIAGSTVIETAISHLAKGLTDLIAQNDAEENDILAMGVGIPALIRADGHLVLGPNLGWHDVPIQQMLAQAFSFPVIVDNDTKAAARAEHLFGSCKNISDYIYITGHSGIGGALVFNGQIRRGSSGFAGEVGHIIVKPEGMPCGCGKKGCLEAYASESAILRQLADKGCILNNLDEVNDHAQQGNTVVQETLADVGSLIGQALACLVDCVDPGTIVLGGNLALVGKWLLEPCRVSLKSNCLPPIFAETTLVISEIGQNSVPMGGIALALEGLFMVPDIFLSSPHTTATP